MPEGGGSVLVGQVEEKPSTHAGMTIAVILIVPGDVRELDLLLDRVETREGEPVPLDEGDHFGMVAAGRALEASFEVEEPSAIVILGRETRPRSATGCTLEAFGHRPTGAALRADADLRSSLRAIGTRLPPVGRCQLPRNPGGDRPYR